MLKLSIIIPVYNAEKHLSACISSILDQNLQKDEYEIIIINDGSSDNSKKIILRFVEKYNNITFLEQKNLGVSVARNRGLDIAKGKYITFVDADDTIHKNTLKKIIQKAEYNNLDILYLSIELYDKNGVYLSKINTNQDENIIAPGINYPRRTFAATLYKKEIISDTRFDKVISFGEDTLFNSIIHIRAKKCSYCSSPYYKYKTHNQSQTKSKDYEKLFLGFLHAIKAINEYKLKNYPQISDQEKDYFDKVSSIFLERILQLTIIPQLNKRRFTRIKELFNEYNINYLIDTISTKYKFFNQSYFTFYSYNSLKKTYNSLRTFRDKIKQIIYA